MIAPSAITWGLYQPQYHCLMLVIALFVAFKVRKIK
jgi:hypothetical protein